MECNKTDLTIRQGKRMPEYVVKLSRFFLVLALYSTTQKPRSIQVQPLSCEIRVHASFNFSVQMGRCILPAKMDSFVRIKVSLPSVHSSIAEAMHMQKQ